MLKSLSVNNFTVFSKAKFDFCRGINVIVGENGLGKSHVLKLGYVSAWISHTIGQNPSEAGNKQALQRKIAEKLTSVFRPDSLGRLASRGPGRTRAEVKVSFYGDDKARMDYSFATSSKSEVNLSQAPHSGITAPAIFFPTKEVISMFPRFASLYRDYHIEIDETYYDLCLALDRPLLKGPRFQKVKSLLEPLESLIGGAVNNENGRFLIKIPRQGNMEIPLVAEGIRKLASVAYLVANGSLMDKATLYWDEPETNLNPKLISKLAGILVEIAKQGTQVILATHSLFLLKEIDLQLKSPELVAQIESKFFALARTGEGTNVEVHFGETADSIDPIAALDAEIEQGDRFLQLEPTAANANNH